MRRKPRTNMTTPNSKFNPILKFYETPPTLFGAVLIHLSFFYYTKHSLGREAIFSNDEKIYMILIYLIIPLS